MPFVVPVRFLCPSLEHFLQPDHSLLHLCSVQGVPGSVAEVVGWRVLLISCLERLAASEQRESEPDAENTCKSRIKRYVLLYLIRLPAEIMYHNFKTWLRIWL